MMPKRKAGLKPYREFIAMAEADLDASNLEQIGLAVAKEVFPRSSRQQATVLEIIDHLWLPDAELPFLDLDPAETARESRRIRRQHLVQRSLCAVAIHDTRHSPRTLGRIAMAAIDRRRQDDSALARRSWLKAALRIKRKARSGSMALHWYRIASAFLDWPGLRAGLLRLRREKREALLLEVLRFIRGQVAPTIEASIKDVCVHQAQAHAKAVLSDRNRRMTPGAIVRAAALARVAAFREQRGMPRPSFANPHRTDTNDADGVTFRRARRKLRARPEELSR